MGLLTSCLHFRYYQREKEIWKQIPLEEIEEVMPFNKSLAEIDESDLQTLVDNQVLEGKTIEYKSILPSNANGDNRVH